MLPAWNFQLSFKYYLLFFFLQTVEVPLSNKSQKSHNYGGSNLRLSLNREVKYCKATKPLVPLKLRS
jgi:hypothetical protein